MRGYAELGVQHIMFQYAPYTDEARRRLTEALRLYHGSQDFGSQDRGSQG
jgi:hypothetical protein